MVITLIVLLSNGTVHRMPDYVRASARWQEELVACGLNSLKGTTTLLVKLEKLQELFQAEGAESVTCGRCASHVSWRKSRV